MNRVAHLFDGSMSRVRLSRRHFLAGLSAGIALPLNAFAYADNGAAGEEASTKRINYEGKIVDLLPPGSAVAERWVREIDLAIEDINDPASIPTDQSNNGARFARLMFEKVIPELKKQHVRAAASVDYVRTTNERREVLSVNVKVFQAPESCVASWKRTLAPSEHVRLVAVKNIGESAVEAHTVAPEFSTLYLRRANVLIRIALLGAEMGAAKRLATHFDNRLKNALAESQQSRDTS